MIKEPEDEEFERIEREQAEREKAMGWRKRQIEDEPVRKSRPYCPQCGYEFKGFEVGTVSEKGICTVKLWLPMPAPLLTI